MPFSFAFIRKPMVLLVGTILVVLVLVSWYLGCWQGRTTANAQSQGHLLQREREFGLREGRLEERVARLEKSLSNEQHNLRKLQAAHWAKENERPMVTRRAAVRKAIEMAYGMRAGRPRGVDLQMTDGIGGDARQRVMYFIKTQYLPPDLDWLGCTRIVQLPTADFYARFKGKPDRPMVTLVTTELGWVSLAKKRAAFIVSVSNKDLAYDGSPGSGPRRHGNGVLFYFGLEGNLVVDVDHWTTSEWIE